MVNLRTYETLVNNINKGGNCIGGNGGSSFVFTRKGEVVRKVEFWANSDHNVLKGLSVTFTDGFQSSGGKCEGSNYKSFTFQPGETLPEVRMCGNGVGTRCGFFELWSTAGSKFKVGKWEGKDVYRFPDAEGRILTGFFGNAGDEIDCLGVVVTKKVKNSDVQNVCYDQSHLNKVMLQAPITHQENKAFNNGASTEQEFTFSYSKWQETKWEHTVGDITSNSPKLGFSFTKSFGLAAAMPVASASATVSSEFSWSSEHNDTTTNAAVTAHKTDDKWTLKIPPGKGVKATVTQKELHVSLKWTADLIIELEDGSKHVQKVRGESNAAVVSSTTYDTVEV